MLERLAALTVLLTASSTLPGFDKLPEPAHFRVTLELDKALVFIGEPVLLHYCVENTGDQPFQINVGGDYRATGYPTRFKVTVVDANGVELPKTPIVHPSMTGGGIASIPELKPGKKWWESIPLHKYRMVNEPGIYKVSVSHDLGWNADSRIEKRTATALVEFVLPTAVDARRVLDDLFTRREHLGVSGERTEPYQDFSGIRNSAYLPLLKAHVLAGGAKRLLACDGNFSINTPEATQSLIELLSVNDPSLRKKIVNELYLRLPFPEWKSSPPVRLKVLAAWGGTGRQERAQATWRAEYSPALRSALRRLLAHEEWDEVSAAAEVLALTATTEDIPALLPPLTRALDASTAPKYREAVNPPSHAALISMVKVYESLLAQGIELPELGRSQAETFLYCVRLSHNPAFRPAGWEMRVNEALNSDLPDLLLYAMDLLPRPVSREHATRCVELTTHADLDVKLWAINLLGEEKIEAGRASVMTTLQSTSNASLRHAAFRAAEKLGARYDALVLLAKNLDSDEWQENLHLLIGGVVEFGNRSSRDQPDEERAGLRQRWEVFLAANRERLERNQRFKPGEPGLDPHLFYRWSFGITGDKRWPK